MKSRKLFLIVLMVLFVSVSYAQKGYEKDPPERIMLNLTATPATSMAVTWRSSGDFKDSYAEIAEAGDWIGFAENAKKIKAQNEKVILDNGETVYHHSVIFAGLKPSTLYAYRVCNGSDLSEWNQFTTASLENKPFSFLYLGDPQNEIKEHVSRIFREAYKKAPEASFWVLAGDITTEPTLDSLWAELFYAAGFIPGSTPFMPVPGNHEYRKNPKMDSKQNSKTKSITPLWRPHFTLPENGIPSLKETSYFFDYQDVRFVMLNGTENFAGQIPWLEKVLSENKCKWTVVTMHQPVYSMGKGRDNKEIHELLVPIYDKYHVDLVLQGHDHTYGRTFKLNDNKIVGNNQSGTVYVVSVSGPKAYDLNPLYADLMAKTGEKTQLFQEISINGGHLIYKSYTVTGKLFDSFELNK